MVAALDSGGVDERGYGGDAAVHAPVVDGVGVVALVHDRGLDLETVMVGLID